MDIVLYVYDLYIDVLGKRNDLSLTNSPKEFPCKAKDLERRRHIYIYYIDTELRIDNFRAVLGSGSM